MPRQNRTRLINQVEQLKHLLRDLNLKLTALDKHETALWSEKDQLQVGDRVIILNPKRGQPSKGTLVKVNRTTNRGTVLGRTPSRQEIKVVRHAKNLSTSQ